MAQRSAPPQQQQGGGGRQKVQKVMTQPINVIFRFFQSKARVQVWLYDQADTRIEGTSLFPFSLPSPRPCPQPHAPPRCHHGLR